jgi:hypothetical protein
LTHNNVSAYTLFKKTARLAKIVNGFVKPFFYLKKIYFFTSKKYTFLPQKVVSAFIKIEVSKHVSAYIKKSAPYHFTTK